MKRSLGPRSLPRIPGPSIPQVLPAFYGHHNVPLWQLTVTHTCTCSFNDCHSSLGQDLKTLRAIYSLMKLVSCKHKVSKSLHC